uniref:ubiquitinyl hydrolase 1 n=1 Tax=Meloidogyne javanica TaxID=6303 RepID=A0A915MBY7_MELJA
MNRVLFDEIDNVQLLTEGNHQSPVLTGIPNNNASIAGPSMAATIGPKLGHTGLVNKGNTCFMNATLQALFHAPLFSHLLRGHCVANFINTKNSLGTKGIISASFSALIDIAWFGGFSSICPSSFLKIFGKELDKRSHFTQNYSGSNLMASAEDYIKKARHVSSSPINDISNLLSVSVLQCKSCSIQSARFEELNQISVALPNNNLESGRIFRLKECLNTHFSKTNLDTPWDCPNCKSKQEATKTTKIWSFPKILIIHLNRFSSNLGRFVKNEVDVHFDIENFDLAPYTHPQLKFLQNKVLYNLFAVTADLAIVVTTKAGLTTVDGSGAFWNDERRVNVALSRGKFGMVVIGDFKMLWTAGGIWRRFLKKALEKTVAVTPDYIEAMADPEAEYENGVLVGPNGTVSSSNFYDEWKEHDSNISQEVPASEFANLGFGQPSTSQPSTSRRRGQQPRLCHRCRLIFFLTHNYVRRTL